jgi:hypothetical protein
MPDEMRCVTLKHFIADSNRYTSIIMSAVLLQNRLHHGTRNVCDLAVAARTMRAMTAVCDGFGGITFQHEPSLPRTTHRHSPFSSIEHGRISLKHLGCTYPSKTTREHSIYFHEQSAVVLAWAAHATTYMNTKVSAPKTRGLPWQQGTAPGSHTTCAQSQRLVPHGHEGSEPAWSGRPARK